MRRLFDDELNDIDANFTEMGMMVSETIEKAVKAFIDHDRDLAQFFVYKKSLIMMLKSTNGKLN